MSNVFFLHQEIRRPTPGKPAPVLFIERRHVMRTNAKPVIQKQERTITQCGEVIGKNLQRILDRQGVSQSELARMLGTQATVICEICNGKRNVSINRLDKIRALLGVDCYEFPMPTIKPE